MTNRVADLRHTVGTVLLVLILALAAPAHGAEPDPVAVVDAFHAARAGTLVWVEDGDEPSLTVRGALVDRALSRAGREGLNPNDYALSYANSGAELDRAVTTALLRYLTDLQTGRVAPRKADPDLFVFRRDVDGLTLLNTVADAERPDRVMADLAPGNPIYRRLRRLLLEYTALANSGGWPSVPEGETIKPGMTDPRVLAIRRRLAATEDLTASLDKGSTYDPEMESAVRAFQRRHGLDADGAIGKKTIIAMNVPVEDRVRQITLNMERFRWIPDDLGDDHIFVNMAGFELDYVVQGVTRLAMRVVVGRQYRETPIFSDRIRYLEFNPTWTVPPKIAANDIMAKVKKDPNYLISGNYEVYAGWQDSSPRLDPSKIDWSAIPKGKFPYRLRQAPGEKNALGQVKFMFPNEFDVYLHDTPARELFRKSVRTFSSGCIRLEKPVTLAEAVLQADGQDPSRVREILQSKKTTRINLATPLPVHLAYLTAWIGEGGTIEFRDDIYGRDALLAKALGL